MTHQVVSCIQTVVVCVVEGGGESLVNMGFLTVFSKFFFKGDRATQWFRVHRQWLLFMCTEYICMTIQCIRVLFYREESLYAALDC